MKNKLLYILFFTTISFYSQNKNEFVTVKYNTFLLDNSEDFGCFYYENNTLITNHEESIYIETPKDTMINTIEQGDLNNFDADYKYIYYKNFKKNTILFDRNYGAKKIVIDSLNIINWKLNENSKIVMGYNCQEAECNFRGRNYKAYFLKDIPYKNGPFKFNGLPGLILKVISTDGSVNIEAYEIEYSIDVKSEIRNPFIGKKNITWSEFKEFYKKRYEKVSSYMPEDGVIMSIPKGYIENFID